MAGPDGVPLPDRPTLAPQPASQGPAPLDCPCAQQGTGTPVPWTVLEEELTGLPPAGGSPRKAAPRSLHPPPHPEPEPTPVPEPVPTPTHRARAEGGNNSLSGSPAPCSPRFLLEVLPRLNVARLLVHQDAYAYAPTAPGGPTGATPAGHGQGRGQSAQGGTALPGAGTGARAGQGLGATGTAPAPSGAPQGRPGAWLEQGHCIRLVYPGLVHRGPVHPELAKGTPPGLSEVWVPLPSELLPRINWAACGAHRPGAHPGSQSASSPRQQQQQQQAEGTSGQAEGGSGHMQSLPLALSQSQYHAELKIPLLAQPGPRHTNGTPAGGGPEAGWGLATPAATTESLVQRMAAHAPLQVLCSSCSREVSAPGASLRECVELPPLGSALEMSEQWFCGGCCAEGGGPRHAQRVMEALQRRLQVQPGKALVGPTALVVHRSDVRLALPSAEHPPGAEAGAQQPGVGVPRDLNGGPSVYQGSTGTTPASSATADSACGASNAAKRASTAPPVPAAAQQTHSERTVNSAREGPAEGGCCPHGSTASGASHPSATSPPPPGTASASPCAEEGAPGRATAPGGGSIPGPQSWELPEMLPGREPWEALRCACGSVLGAARVHRGNVAQLTGKSGPGASAGHTPSPESRRDVPGESRESVGEAKEAFGEPRGFLGESREPSEGEGNGKGEQERSGGPERGRDAPGAPPLVHLYPHRVELVAPGRTRTEPPLTWNTEGAYALKLAQLFSPGAGAGLSLSSRLLVRDLNAPHAPLLQLLLLDCHGLLAPGVCARGAPQAPQGCATTSEASAGSPGMARTCSAQGRGVPDVAGVSTRMGQLGLTAEGTGVQGPPHTQSGTGTGAGAGGGAGAGAEALGSRGGSSGWAPSLERAVRVIFRGANTTHSSVQADMRPQSPSAMESWAQKGGAEELHMMQDEAKHLQRVLEANAMFYPPAVRCFDGFVCSFLRLPR